MHRLTSDSVVCFFIKLGYKSAAAVVVAIKTQRVISSTDQQ